jgi:hypothetical protein
MTLLISAFWVARITGVRHRHLGVLFLFSIFTYTYIHTYIYVCEPNLFFLVWFGLIFLVSPTKYIYIYLVLKTGFLYVSQADLELSIFLFPPPKH